MDYEAIMQQALMYIDANLLEPIDLAQVAAAVHLSPYHFHRVFAAWTGEPLMAYIRMRRLALAAQRLMDPDRRIHDIAFDCQFSSQATFTRAFQQAFGVTPGRYRRSGANMPLRLTIPIRGKEGIIMTRLVEGLPLTFVGLVLRDLVTGEPNSPRIQALWREFLPRVSELTGVQGGTYGVCIPGEGARFSYMAAVAVDPSEPVPEGMARHCIGPQAYAAFPHDEEVSEYADTYQRIWSEGLPATGRSYKEGAVDLEVYPEAWQEKMQVEIWIPVV